MNEKLSFALKAVAETSPHQFRKVLYVGSNGTAKTYGLVELFRNARISEFQTDINELNQATQGQVCFDLIIFDQIGFSQIDQLLKLFKYRYIVLIGNHFFLNPVQINASYYQVESGLSVYKSNVKYFDIFMPIGPSDYSIASASVINKYSQLQGVREIFYCATQPLDINATFVAESDYPFTEEAAVAAFGVRHERFGWYYQQLKQLYLYLARPYLLDNYITMCTDLFFNKCLPFFEGDTPIYSYGHSPLHGPYFEHMRKLHPQLRCFDGRSAISHHSIFNRHVLLDLFSEVKCHTGKEFWEAFLSNVDPQQRLFSGAAEYEIYFNFLRLKGTPLITREPNYIDTGDFQHGLSADCHYFAYHWYMRTGAAAK
jgi:hypothetical protein